MGRRADLLALIEILDAAGLRGRKAAEYDIWRRAVLDWATIDRDEARARLLSARRYVEPPLRPTPASSQRSWLIDVLAEWAENERGPLSQTKYASYAAERGLPTRNTVAAAFGSWHDAMCAVGVLERCVRKVPREVTAPTPRDVEPRRRAVVAVVRTLTRELGRPPTVSEYLAFRLERDRTLPSNMTTYRLFPGGWSSVLDAAGVARPGTTSDVAA